MQSFLCQARSSEKDDIVVTEVIYCFGSAPDQCLPREKSIILCDNLRSNIFRQNASYSKLYFTLSESRITGIKTISLMRVSSKV